MSDSTRTREEEREAEERRTRAESEAKDAKQDIACPECSGDLVVDEERGETVCGECGLVVEEDSIDRGPEWRAFNATENDQKSRVGAPTTNMMHDKGLSTNIGWQNKDAYGNSLSGRQRRKMQRLRKWNERFRTRNSKERNLKQALGEIERMSSALGLPDNVRETASVIYRRALNEDLLPGAPSRASPPARSTPPPRGRRTPSQPRRGGQRQPGRARRDRPHLPLRRPRTRPRGRAHRPRELRPRFCSELDLPDEVERRARELLTAAEDAGITSGKSPVGLAAAAVYAASLLTNERITQSEVSDVANISEVTIRNRYHEILEAGGEESIEA